MMDTTMRIACFVLSAFPALVQSQEGLTYEVCSNTAINGYNQKWGYIVSDHWPGKYWANQSCSFEIDVPNPQYQYVALRVLDWTGDQSGYGDRMTIWNFVNGNWYWANDLYASNWPSWIDGYRNLGHIRIYWYTDAFVGQYWSGTHRWRLAWTFQKYVFGCELYPSPYIFGNTTKSGIVQSPFFPDHYPVNSYCITTIDVDQSTDLIEFVPTLFHLRDGDYVYFYVGDASLGNWVQYAKYNTNPGTFRIYGADVRIIFTSDYLACSYGYQFYWRVISKERYPLYKAESLAGFWPMTAAHRGIDVVQGCNANAFPASGSTSITPSAGPFGNPGVSLSFKNAYLQMSSTLCATSTFINSSYSISIFAATDVAGALVEYIQTSGTTGLYLYSNSPGAAKFQANDQLTHTPDIMTDLPKWQYLTMTLNMEAAKIGLFVDAVQRTNTTGPTTTPPATKGFYFGYRQSDSGTQTGRFSCLSMYREALLPEDIAQTRVMCQKFHEQYQIYPGSTLVGWWPLDNRDSSGKIRDYSGNGLHLTAQSTVQVVQATPGPAGTGSNALHFNGSTDAYATANTLPLMKSFTVSVFVKSTVSATMPIIEFFGPSNTRGVVLNIDPATNFYANINYNNTGSGGGISSAASYLSWIFVSATYDSRAGIFATWINAAQQVSQNRGPNYTIGMSESGFWLGKQINSSDWWDGDMACLSIYASALTQTQIQKVMEACQSGLKNPPALIELLGFWPLTNLTNFLDISGNNYHGAASSANVILSAGPFGVPNTAFTIGTDSSSYIKMNHIGLNLGSRSWTISCFVKSLNSIGPFFEIVNTSTTSGLHWWLYNDRMYFNNYAQNVTVAGFNWNQWQFISAVYDSDVGNITLYRDGANLISWAADPSTGTDFGFNIGWRASGSYLNAQVSCLSIYQVALDVDGLGGVMGMCQSYLMDQALRDQTTLPEINCNFDNGFCGWAQDVNDDFDWQLGHDQTPTGQPIVFTTGPRFGKSAERIDALDQYAYINTAAAGFLIKARLVSPVIPSGWHCLEFWYYMGGATVNSLQVYQLWSGRKIFEKVGSQGKQWSFAAVSFYVDRYDPDQIAFDGLTGTDIYSDIAIDSVRVTGGKCSASTPCPRGWLDFGRKCYMSFISMSLDAVGARTHCQSYLKARPALPENEQELAFVQSLIGNETIYLNGQYLSNDWVDSANQKLHYLPWASGSPGSPTNDLSFITLRGDGFHSMANSTYSTVCEITKLEAQHLGFNCSFDNKHTCGWTNNQANGQMDTMYSGASLDADTWAGISMPWDNITTPVVSTEDTENGPEWDWNHGNARGYYLLVSDKVYPTCASAYTDIYSPMMKTANRPQCLRFRHYRTVNVNKTEVITLTVSNTGTKTAIPTGLISGINGLQWRTIEVELNPSSDYVIIIRMWASCSGLGNHAIDDIELFDSTCTVTLYSNSEYNSTRPHPGKSNSVDTLGDNNFYICDQSNSWRYYSGYVPAVGASVNATWACGSFQHSAGFRRTGPQSDYTGEGNYFTLDHASSSSLTGLSRFSGPPIPSGQHCFVFHYYQHGYDIGELRLLDGNNRALWARQRTQNPAWKEHRILFNSVSPIVLNFEGSSGLNDSNTHFQRYQSLQLDDLYTRNGSDICLGFMDCDFDSSSYLLNCGWQQNDTDDADWVRNSAETPAGNANTGPNADQTTGLGHYLFFDATNLRFNASARIHMPPIACGTHCLTFYYYMWGKDLGTLRVFYVPQGNLRLSEGNFPPYAEQTVWQRSGEQANYWLRAMVPVKLNYSQVLTFEARRGNGDRGDIAIDDVVVLEGSCPNDRSISCSFERADACTWYNDPTADLSFVVNRGKSRGSPMSGPEGDATGAYAGGFYIYMAAADGVAGKLARLLSPILPPGSVCLQLSYNMRGRKIGLLNIYRNSEQIYRVRAGSTGYEWRRIRTQIDSNSSFVIKIEAVHGSSQNGDIAIDDIVVSDGPCGAKSLVADPLFEYSQMAGYSLNGHVISSRKVTSLAFCISVCRASPECLSVNYNSATTLCQLNNAVADSDPYNYNTTTSDWTHVWVISKYSELDMRLQNLCNLDSPQCTLTRDCVQLQHSSMFACNCVEKGRSCYMPQDCSIAFSYGYLSTGVYLISPTLTANPFMVWCEMNVVNKIGYTYLVKRYNGGTRFHNRKLAEYELFFGSPSREYWVGLEAMSQLTNQAKYRYVIEGSVYDTVYPSVSGGSLAQPFVVAGPNDHYRITLAATDTMTATMNNMMFSTMDADQTGQSECVRWNGNSGWWYNNCHEGLLTGIYRPREAVAYVDSNGMYSINFGNGTALTAMSLKIARL